MKRKNKKFQKKGSNSLNKLSLFQKNDGKFSKKCPLSIKNAPIVDYKNVNLLKKYVSENGKIISGKFTSVSFSKQKNIIVYAFTQLLCRMEEAEVLFKI